MPTSCSREQASAVPPVVHDDITHLLDEVRVVIEDHQAQREQNQLLITMQAECDV
jgi:hypothetical protein